MRESRKYFYRLYQTGRVARTGLPQVTDPSQSATAGFLSIHFSQCFTHPALMPVMGGGLLLRLIALYPNALANGRLFDMTTADDDIFSCRASAAVLRPPAFERISHAPPPRSFCAADKAGITLLRSLISKKYALRRIIKRAPGLSPSVLYILLLVRCSPRSLEAGCFLQLVMVGTVMSLRCPLCGLVL